METKEPDFNDPNFTRSNPDIWVQAVFNILDRHQLKEPEGDKIPDEEEEPFNRDARIKVVSSWGVPKRIAENLKDLKDTKAIRIVEDFINAPDRGWCLILSADKGAGKSTAAAYWLMKQAIMADLNPSVMGAPVRKWWSGTRLARVNGYNSEFEKLAQVSFMVLDDLGIEYLDKNGNFLQRLDEIMDERYSNYRKTIITTNLNSEDFKARYGERIADRIREGFNHGGAFMELSDKSMRSNKK
tara:strand:+ start:961 stop:1686 length:726 start_codon:yes stop_codon:yes gene_type:complete